MTDEVTAKETVEKIRYIELTNDETTKKFQRGELLKALNALRCGYTDSYGQYNSTMQKLRKVGVARKTKGFDGSFGEWKSVDGRADIYREIIEKEYRYRVKGGGVKEGYFETRHEAVGVKAGYERRNPDVEFYIDIEELDR